VGFIVTNLEMDSRAVVRFYNERARRNSGLGRKSKRWRWRSYLPPLSVERGAAAVVSGKPPNETAVWQRAPTDHRAVACGDI